MSAFSSFLSLLLTGLLVTLPVIAETAPAEGAPLQLRVFDRAGNPLAGELPGHSVSSLVVEVKDGTGRPVSNAAVVMRLPDDGAAATFHNGERSAVSYTDDAGLAHLADIQWGEAPGTVAARLTASSGTAHAGMLLEERIVPAAAPVSPAPVRVIVAPPTVPVDANSAATQAPKRSVRPIAQLPEVAEAAAETPIAPVAVDSSNVPFRRALLSTGEAPMISITSNGKPSRSEGHGKVKWIIIGAAAAAGAGAALALMHGGKGGGSSAGSGISIGPPTVSVGLP